MRTPGGSIATSCRPGRAKRRCRRPPSTPLCPGRRPVPRRGESLTPRSRGAPAPGGRIPALCTPGAARTRSYRPPGLAGTRSYRPPGAAGTRSYRPPGAARTRSYRPPGVARTRSYRPPPRGRAATGPRAPRGRAATGPRAPRGGTGNGRRAGCCAPAGAWPPAAARIQRRGAGAGARRPGLHRKRAGRLQRGGAARSRRAGRRASAVAWPRAAGRRRRTAGVWRCLDLLPAALRAGGGTRSSAHGGRPRLQTSGEVGAGRSRRRPYPARPSHRRSRGFPEHAAIAPLRPVSLRVPYRLKPRTSVRRSRRYRPPLSRGSESAEGLVGEAQLDGAHLVQPRLLPGIQRDLEQVV